MKCYLCGRGVNTKVSHCMVELHTEDGVAIVNAHKKCGAAVAGNWEDYEDLARVTLIDGKSREEEILYEQQFELEEVEDEIETSDAEDTGPNPSLVPVTDPAAEQINPPTDPTPPGKHGWLYNRKTY